MDCKKLLVDSPVGKQFFLQWLLQEGSDCRRKKTTSLFPGANLLNLILSNSHHVSLLIFIFFCLIPLIRSDASVYKQTASSLTESMIVIIWVKLSVVSIHYVNTKVVAWGGKYSFCHFPIHEATSHFFFMAWINYM